ncbi:methyltransferase-like protein 27 [Biomphalaria glabrata]|uniref:Methyltransferase-like protein 27 n=1 Tax=Biomphalaria glabrata TaxID=6526 RepID=A0A9W2ZES3_BIOGL|nr:methyltransferase-like protein 27 [Biomphalaria glabrata]
MASQPASNPFTHIPGLSKEELARRYTQWAEQQKYEHDLREEVYKGPAIVADVMINLFPEEKSRKDIYILDVAAGTGFVAEKLIQEGFEKFDALEPSEGLLNLAIAKGIYSKTFQTFITDTPTYIESDSYDVVIVCGGFGENHIPCSGLDEFIRLVKPGGHVVIAMSETFLTSVLEYKDRLEPRMKRLEDDGKWVSIRRTVVPRYFDVYNGVVFVFQVSK